MLTDEQDRFYFKKSSKSCSSCPKKVVKIQKMFKISRQAVHKEIIKLIELNLIEQKGAGKAIHYVIKQVDARVDGKVDVRLLE